MAPQVTVAIPLQDLLPDAAFVPFEARGLANPWMVYSNPDFETDAAWIRDFAFLIPSDIDDATSFTSYAKEFLAERYGGTGLLGHGGGARVGLAGGYEVKGIGINPLCDAGRPSGAWARGHSHGALPLVDAILEAAWGEVLSSALPFGAMRVTAILGTGTLCWEHGDGTDLRALAIREAALRPAHFMRATFFRASKRLKLIRDAVRVSAAINRLPCLLPLPAGMSDPRQVLPGERLVLGLQEVVRRWAEQSAAARAKRLMHGALTASNMTLDGRWLDFGTVTALPQYANTHNLGWPRGHPTFWEDHFPILATIRELSFYIRKYLRETDLIDFDSMALRDAFLDTYEAALRRRFLSLTGVPEEFYTASLTEPERRHLGEILISVARYGVHARFQPAVSDLTQYGANALGLALVTMASMHDKEDCSDKLSKIIGSPSLCHQFYSSCRALFAAAGQAAESAGLKLDALRRVTSLNAARAAMPAPLLYRPSMSKRCERLVAEHRTDRTALHSGVRELIEKTATFARLVLAPEPRTECVTWQSTGSEVAFDARANAWRIRSQGALRYLPWSVVARAEAQDLHPDFFGSVLEASQEVGRAKC